MLTENYWIFSSILLPSQPLSQHFQENSSLCREYFQPSIRESKMDFYNWKQFGNLITTSITVLCNCKNLHFQMVKCQLVKLWNFVLKHWIETAGKEQMFYCKRREKYQPKMWHLLLTPGYQYHNFRFSLCIKISSKSSFFFLFFFLETNLCSSEILKPFCTSACFSFNPECFHTLI